MPDESEFDLNDPREESGERARVEREADSTAQLVTRARPFELATAEFRDVSFSPALGGYNRRQVDAYVERVNRAIAELEISGSPEKAVKLALDRVAEQTAGILQEAREAAEKLRATARSESEHASRRGRVEAEELMERAETESRALLERSAAESEDLLAHAHAGLDELRAQIEQARDEHSRVLAQLRATAAALSSLAARSADGEPAQREPPPPGSDGAEDMSEQPTVVTPALEVAPSGGDDAVGGGRPAPARRRIAGPRHPRPPKPEAAESGRSQPD